jgi:hypothetical protein
MKSGDYREIAAGALLLLADQLAHLRTVLEEIRDKLPPHA